MKKIILLVLLVLIALITVQAVHAEEKHLKLLAVSETESGYEGSSADLYLEIKPGKNRVFMDTFPLTKMDTQMSTRFAKSIACDFLNINCENYDFFYTIRADTTIIGGPSAGGALAAITVASLENIELDDSIAITGTINSGGLIGSVGGLKEKIDAAAELKLRKVLIPKGERFVENKTIAVTNNLFTEKGKTIDLVEYGKEKGIEVVEVSNLNEVMYEFTGKKLKQEVGNIEINPQYEEIMKGIATDLCDRSSSLKTKAPEEYKSIEESALNLTTNGMKAFENKEYYSAASFCFGANIKYSELRLVIQNLTQKEYEEKLEEVEKNIDVFEKEIEKKKINTVCDLQTYMVVEERILEAKDSIKKGRESKKTEEKIFNLAFAQERLKSADSWARFFGQSGVVFVMDKDMLKSSCINKIAEAEERYQYVTLFLPTALETTKEEIELAKKDEENGDYELCLFKASKAKAEANSILSAIYLGDEDNLKKVIGQKLEVAKENIAEEQGKLGFPILGYSYYEYAKVLKENDPYSALLYIEYALELSDLDIYFIKAETPQTSIKEEKKPQFNAWVIYILIYGILIGYILSVILRRENPKKPLKGFPKKTLRGKKR